MLICVGNFFGINNKEFTDYKVGNKKGWELLFLIDKREM